MRQNAIEESEGVVEFWSELLTTQSWAGMVNSLAIRLAKIRHFGCETKEVVQNIPLSAVECIFHLEHKHAKFLKRASPSTTCGSVTSH